MTANLQPLRRVPPAVEAGWLSRAYGLGSVFGKALRDSRTAIIVVTALVGVMVLALGSFFGTAYATNRQQLIDLAASIPPAAKGIFWGSGDMSSFSTLGGYVSIDAQFLYKLVPGLWAILALSATLTVETNRGSLEFVAATPSTRRRIALQKVAAHVAAMAVVAVAVAFLTWLTGRAFAKDPVDAISAGAAISWTVWLGLLGLIAGSIAFVLAPWVGRAGAAGIAGSVMFAGYVVDAFQGWVPAFGTLGSLSWFSWTAKFNPLAGQWDWGSLALVALVAVVLLAIGVEGFARRDLDLGGRSSVGTPGVPAVAFWVRGPITRSLGGLLPGAIGWGLGIGLYGFIISASSRSFADALADTPDLMATLRSLVPAYDMATAAGLLQGAFMAFAFVIGGLAAATLISGWAADETSGRLEMLLTTPLPRARWAIASGIGVLIAIAAMTGVVALAIALGVASAGGDVVAPVVGTFALGLYAAALAGVGFAVGGLFSARAAGVVVGVVAVAMFLIDFLVPALNLPTWLRQLALSADMGQTMVGNWNPTGVIAALVLALGGLALGGWGMRLRDVSR